MQHQFDIDIATEYGINAAIIIENMRFWISKNEANDTNFHDGRYWTYNSVKAFETLFPYMSISTISRTLKKLEEDGLIITGNYNKSSYDRTKWYAFTDKANELFKMCKSISRNDQMDLSEAENGFSENDEPIPDSKPDTKPDKKRERRRFAPPSLEDVRAYCIERGNNVNPKRFIDHYESNGWMVGRSKMKDWRAAVRTWESNGIGKQQPKPKPERRPAKNVEEIMACWGLDREVAKMAFDRKDDIFSYVKEG